MTKKNASFRDIALRVLETEARAIESLRSRLDARFDRALEWMAGCTGKIAITGMRKSGLICKKIAATLSSTGSPSIFLHAAEAAHGDLGLLRPGDVVLALSKSGETQEILRILSVLKRLGLPLIALVGDMDSSLARDADVALDVSVDVEACPLGLAPTASTAAALAMGDALAMALMQKKGFRSDDFASVHPAGAIGKKLLRVEVLMHRGESVPSVTPETPMKEALAEMSRKGLGMTTVVGPEGHLLGVITDGDLRRLFERAPEKIEGSAGNCMSRNPQTVAPAELAAAALKKMESLRITSLVAVDHQGRVEGVLQIHDLWRTQLF